MSLLQNSNAIPTAGATDFYEHQIANSCRFNQSATAHMYHTQGTPTNADKCTISAWVKRGKMGNADSMFTGSGIYGYDYSWFGFNTANEFYAFQDPNGPRLESNAVFRDPSAWMHIVIATDTTQGTAANRNKIYINGVQYTDWGDYETYSTQNQDMMINSSGRKIFVGSGGASEGNSWLPFDGYIAEYVFIDGTQYAATDFGETKNGVWIPKDPSGLTFGNNGCYLKFESSSDLGNDSSGNNNDFTLSNVSAHDQMLDSPSHNADSNGGNFCTYNPLNAGSYATLSEGNLKALGNTSSDIAMPSGTFAMTSGKWYFERLIANESSGYPYLGLAAIGNVAYNTNTGGDIWAMRFAPAAGTVAANGTAANVAGFGTITATSTGLATATTGDIIGFHLDLDNRKCWITKNGAFVNSGDPSAGTNPQWSWTATPNNPISFIDQIYNGTGSILNAGQDGTFAGEKTAQGNSDDTGYGNFYYAPDTGFLAMCSGNLPVADAINPSKTNDNYPQKLFQAFTWTGDGNTTRSFTLNFKPDFSWAKQRSHGYQHILYDTSRTYATLKALGSSGTWIEGGGGDNSGNGYFSSSDSSGFSVNRGTNTSAGTSLTNSSSTTYASWHWRANGGTTSTNTQGDTNSTVQVDPSGHFSIVLGTGDNDNWGNPQTFGHGLSAAPNCIIGKKRADNNDEWQVFFSDYGNYSIGGSTPAHNSLVLNSNSALYTNQSYKGWGGVMPTSTVFTLDGNNLVQNGDTFVCYCFANCEGYIKSGIYYSNTSATDNAFVWTGFRPAFLLVKALGSGHWQLIDNKRNGFNPQPESLDADRDNASRTNATDFADLLANGFKVRTDNQVLGEAAQNPYVYLAMAENPFAFATAR